MSVCQDQGVGERRLCRFRIQPVWIGLLLAVCVGLLLVPLLYPLVVQTQYECLSISAGWNPDAGGVIFTAEEVPPRPKLPARIHDLGFRIGPYHWTLRFFAWPHPKE